MTKRYHDAEERLEFKAWLKGLAVVVHRRSKIGKQNCRRRAAYLRRAEFVDLILGSWREDPSRASEFWRQVIQMDHPDVANATRRMGDIITDTSYREERAAAALERKLRNAYVFYGREKVFNSIRQPPPAVGPPHPPNYSTVN